MTEEQKKAYKEFATVASQKGVSVGVVLAVASVMFDGDDWRGTLDDITRLLYECKTAIEFENRFFIEYPGLEVEPGFAEDDE